MGDYHWYGHNGTRDVDEATRLYGLAAMKGDPQVSTCILNRIKCESINPLTAGAAYIRVFIFINTKITTF